MATKITATEWYDEGRELFGVDKLGWRFRCPGCGHVQTPADFAQYRAKGATPATAYKECIGRFNGALLEENQGLDLPGCAWSVLRNQSPQAPIVLQYAQGHEMGIMDYDRDSEE